MVLECRIPISPKPDWINRTRLLAYSIWEYYPDAIMHIYIGEPGGVSDASKALVEAGLPGMMLEYIDGVEFDQWNGTRAEYIATMNRRFTGPVLGDHVLILDADVVCMNRFDGLFYVDRVQGVIAHVPPMDQSSWRQLFAMWGHGVPTMNYGYSGAGVMIPAHAECGPFYVNSGVVFAPRAIFQSLWSPYQEAIKFLRTILADAYWFDQLALALAVQAASVPKYERWIGYNMPNQDGFDQHDPNAVEIPIFIHYLRTDIIHRERDLASWEAACKLVQRRDLTGTNENFRRRVQQLMDKVWPTEAAAALEVDFQHA